MQFPSGEYQSKKLQPQVIHRYVYYSLDLFIPGFSLGEYFQSFRSRHRLPIPGGGHGHFVSVWLNSLVGRIGTMLILILTFIAILFSDSNGLSINVSIISKNKSPSPGKGTGRTSRTGSRAAAAREEAQRQADAQQDPEDEDTTSDSDKRTQTRKEDKFWNFLPNDTRSEGGAEKWTHRGAHTPTHCVWGGGGGGNRTQKHKRGGKLLPCRGAHIIKMVCVIKMCN